MNMKNLIENSSPSYRSSKEYYSEESERVYVQARGRFALLLAVIGLLMIVIEVL